MVYPVVNTPLFFVSISPYVSVNTGIYASPTFDSLNPFKPADYWISGFARIKFKAENKDIYVDIVLTFTAVEPDAKIDSRLVRSGTTPIFSILLPLQFRLPVRG